MKRLLAVAAILLTAQRRPNSRALATLGCRSKGLGGR